MLKNKFCENMQIGGSIDTARTICSIDKLAHVTKYNLYSCTLLYL